MTFRALTAADNTIRASQGLPPAEEFSDGSEAVKNACAAASKASRVGQQNIDTNLAATSTGDVTAEETQSAQATIQNAAAQTTTSSAAAVRAAETASRKAAESTREILGQSQQEALAEAQQAALEAQAAAAQAQESSIIVTGDAKADTQSAVSAAASAAATAASSVNAANIETSEAVDKMESTADSLLQQATGNNEFFDAAALTSQASGGATSALQGRVFSIVKGLVSQAIANFPGMIKIITLPALPIIAPPAIPDFISPVISLKDQVQPPPSIDRLTQRAGALGNQARAAARVSVSAAETISDITSAVEGATATTAGNAINASSISAAVSNATSALTGAVQCSANEGS